MAKQSVAAFIFIITSLIQFSSNSQNKNISFRKVSPPGGFTRYAIQSIVQDDLGYMWMGTQQGLIKYDSNQTEWFVPIANDQTSIPSEVVIKVYVDSKNDIWVSTNRGLCKFNRETQNFKRFRYTYEDSSKGNNNVLSILQVNDGRFLVIDYNNFGILDLNGSQLNRVGKNIIKSPRVLYKDNLNRVWIGTKHGEIFRFSPENNTLSKLFSIGVPVTCIYSENDKVYVGSEESGTKLFNIEGTFIEDIHLKKESELPYTERIRAITRDGYGRLWFGTDDGLYMEHGGVTTWFNPDEYEGIPHNSTFEIYENNKSGLWIGTWSGGLALMHQSDNNFKTYQHSPSHNSISNNVVSSFLQKNKNEILIATEVGGLNSFNLQTKTFDIIPIDKQVSVKNIKTICKDKYGGIWAGTFRKGLWYKSNTSSSFKAFVKGPNDGQHVSSNSIYALHPTDTGIWIGTYNNGLNFYNFDTKTITHSFLNNASNIDISKISIQTILLDENANLWLGTFNNFLYKVELETNEITKISDNKLGDVYARNTIYTLWEHSSGDIWVGTKNNGVLIYNPNTNTFTSFEDGGILDKRNAYGIIEDNNNNIWITSNNGLLLYNPEDETKRHFVYYDDIQSNIFSPQSVFKDSYGDLYFGGTNGFTTINPDKIKVNLKKPFTIIKTIQTGKNTSIYPTYTENFQINPVYLNPDEKTFRVNFSADNYLMPEKNMYKYRLLNNYNDWISVGNESSVLFTSLDAGEYIFEVKASNNDGIWSETPTQMKIIVRKYWYQTWVAYIIYFIVIIGLLYFTSRFYTERMKLRRAFVVEKNERENEEQINEMKLKFFTNVSHEFRTPLTLILWPLKQLINSKNISVEDQNNLDIVKRNTNRLLELVNQIVDLRKLEKGDHELNITRFDVINLIKEIQLGFLGETTSNNIEFLFDSTHEKIEIEADQQKIDTIIYNFLSNATKYVTSKGQIKISIYKQLNPTTNSYNGKLSYGQIHTNEFIQITVEDNGTGIGNEDLFKIFNRFERGQHNDDENYKDIEGSGIGLAICKDFTLLHHGRITVQSTVGFGSRFTILLPTKQKAQKILFNSHQKVKNLNENEVSSILLKNELTPENQNQILVVEDNAELSSLICDFLNVYYNINYAPNGVEALALLKEKKNIDLIISDIMMPEMDGFEFCNLVKSQLETSHIPIILLTALSSAENLIVGLDKGADAYLTKPFNENVLLKQIENLLDQRKRIQKTFSKEFISKRTIEVGGLDNFFLNKVRTSVESNLSDETFNIEKLATELMMSRSNLHRKIKSLSGLSTSEFVNLIRLKYAVKLIKEENCRFNEVAFRVGFSSQSYFTRCFKKAYNVSPKEYFKNLEQ